MLAKTCITLFANSSSLNLSFKSVPLAFISKASSFFGLQMGQRAGPLVLHIPLPDLVTRKILKGSVNCQHFPGYCPSPLLQVNLKGLLLLVQDLNLYQIL